MAQLLPLPKMRFFDSNGVPLVGGQLFSYAAGTTTPLATYTDQSEITPNTNPVILDSKGEANVWIASSAYKLVLQDASGNTLWTVDNVSTIDALSVTTAKIANNAITTPKILDGAVTTSKIPDNAIIPAKIPDGSLDAVKLSTKLEVLTKSVRDLSCPGLIQQIPQYEWSSPSLLTSPGTIPGSAAVAGKWSANGEFLAVGTNSTPFVYIYQRSGSTLTKLPNPSTLPTGQALDLAWSPCGDFLVVAHRVTPYVSIYQRSGNSFTKLSNLPSLPSTAVSNAQIAFSPNSDFLTWGFNAGVATGLYIFERNGTTFTDVTSSSGITGVSRPIAWSPDSTYFAAFDFTSGNIDVYKRTDSTFAPIIAPNVSSLTGNIGGFAFSPDGSYFAVAGLSSPYLLLFSFASGIFTPITSPTTLPTAAVNCVAWSANSEYLVLGYSATPFIMIYQVSGVTFTKIADPAVAPAGIVVNVHWGQTKQFLAVSSGTSPYIQVYQTASVLPSNALLWTRGVPNV